MEQLEEKLTACMEDYLEAVLLQVRTSRVARVRDIAGHLHVGMPSVTAALRSLSKRGLVNYDPYQFVTLTDRGQEAAEQISRRHDLLRRFLVDVLGLDEASAEGNACRMEHAVDKAFLDRLEALVDFARRSPQAREDWLKQFSEFASSAHGSHGSDEPARDAEI